MLKRKKIGLPPASSITPYLGPLLITVGAGIVFYKVGQKFGLFPDATERKQKADALAREKIAQQSINSICSLNPTTKTEAEWTEICDTLEHDLDYAGYLQSYRDDTVYQCCRAKNDCDVQKIIFYFGHRALRSPILIKSGDYTLTQAVHERLNSSDIATINNNYANKGIQFRF